MSSLEGFGKMRARPFTTHIVLHMSQLCRVGASITDHLRDFASDREKYKVVQIFLMFVDRN